MTYYETPGVIADVIQFLVIYYNEDQITYKYEVKYNESLNRFLEYYFRFKRTFGDLPEELQLIAYCNESVNPYLISLVYNQLQTITLDSLINYFESDKFVLDIYRHFFGADNIEIKDLKYVEILNKTKKMALPDHIKYKLIVFFDDFNIYRQQFIDLLIKLYNEMKEFRKKEKSVIELGKVKYNNVYYFKKIKSIFNVDITDFGYTISLINSIHYFYDSDSKIICFGVKSYYLLDSIRQISIETFAMAYGEETRVKIVDLIAKNQPVCMSDLKEMLDIKHSTLYHHINILSEEGIISVCKSINKKFYYRINVEYYEKINNLFQSKLNEYKLINKGDVENEKMDKNKSCDLEIEGLGKCY